MVRNIWLDLLLHLTTIHNILQFVFFLCRRIRYTHMEHFFVVAAAVWFFAFCLAASSSKECNIYLPYVKILLRQMLSNESNMCLFMGEFIYCLVVWCLESGSGLFAIFSISE